MLLGQVATPILQQLFVIYNQLITSSHMAACIIDLVLMLLDKREPMVRRGVHLTGRFPIFEMVGRAMLLGTHLSGEILVELSSCVDIATVDGVDFWGEIPGLLSCDNRSDHLRL